jgi:hypothetical protein
MDRRFLHTAFFSVVLLALMGSCGFFFSNETLPGHLTLYLGDTNSARALNDPPKDFPKFSDVTIRITNDGKTST